MDIKSVLEFINSASTKDLKVMGAAINEVFKSKKKKSSNVKSAVKKAKEAQDHQVASFSKMPTLNRKFGNLKEELDNFETPEEEEDLGFEVTCDIKFLSSKSWNSGSSTGSFEIVDEDFRETFNDLLKCCKKAGLYCCYENGQYGEYLKLKNVSFEQKGEIRQVNLKVSKWDWDNKSGYSCKIV